MSVTAQPKPAPNVILNRGDLIFSNVVRVCAVFVIILLVLISLVLFTRSQETISTYGLDFFRCMEWDPQPKQAGDVVTRCGVEVTLDKPLPGIYGSLFATYGTIVTSLLALLIATPFAVGAAIFVSEYCPPRLGDLISFTIELLVAIPSVAFGVFGFIILAPFLKDNVYQGVRDSIGQYIFLFGRSGPLTGTNIATASLILAIMILPTIMALSREVIRQVPRLQKEGMMALGATKWESIQKAVLPYARTGIVGAAMLGLARAIGETMAVTMTIGNARPSQLSGSIFQSTSSLASFIANQFGEALGDRVQASAVIQMGLVLLIVSSSINLFSRWLIARTTKRR